MCGNVVVGCEYIKLSEELEKYIYNNIEDRECKELLFKGYIRLALKIANSFNIKGYDREDIESEAYLGLWQAVLQFKPELGFKFTTFANRCIKNHLLQLVEKRERVLDTMSLDTPISSEYDSDELYLYEVVDGGIDVFNDMEYLVKEAIQKSLTNEERELIQLHYYRDISTRRMEVLLSTHNTAIGRKLNKARNKIVVYMVTGKVNKNITNDIVFDSINKLREMMEGER